MSTLQVVVFSNHPALTARQPARQNSVRLLHALAGRGHRLTYYHPDPHGRKMLTEQIDANGVRSVFFPVHGYMGLFECLEEAEQADVIIKVSGLEVYDGLVDMAVLEVRKPGGIAVWLDPNPNATLDRLRRDQIDSLSGLIPEFDLVMVAGGTPLVGAFKALGARVCFPLWSTLSTPSHRIVPPELSSVRRIKEAGAPIAPTHIEALEHVLLRTLHSLSESPLAEAISV